MPQDIDQVALTFGAVGAQQMNQVALTFAGLTDVQAIEQVALTFAAEYQVQLPEPVVRIRRSGFTAVLQLGGITHQWDRLQVPITESVSWWGHQAASRAITLQLGVPPSLDPSQLRLRGHRITDAFITITYVDDYGLTRVALSGPVTGASWSREGHEVRLTVEEEQMSRGRPFPPRAGITTNSAQWQTVTLVGDDIDVGYVDGVYSIIPNTDAAERILARSPVAPDEVNAFAQQVEDPLRAPTIRLRVEEVDDGLNDGEWYPMVWGKPGVSETGAPMPGTPAIPYDRARMRLIVAYGQVKADQVTLFGPAVGGGDRLARAVADIRQATDDQGRPFSYVTLAGIEQFFDLKDADGLEREWWGDDWYVSWNRGEALPGGLGDFLDMALRQCGVRVDEARTRSLRLRLNGWMVAGYINDEVDGLQWIEEVLKPFPVRLARGPNGLYPVLLDPTCEPFEKVTRELPGQVMHFGDQLTEQSDRAPTLITVLYGHDEQRGERRYTSITDTLSAMQARLSGKGLNVQTIDSVMIVEEATANSAARISMLSSTESDVVFQLQLSWERYQSLELGDVLILDTPELGLVNRRVMVLAKTWDGWNHIAVDVIPCAQGI